MHKWENIIEELKVSFEKQESRMAFLHEIDRKILEEDTSLEDLCKFVLEHLVNHTESDLGYVFIDAGDDALLLHCTEETNGKFNAISDTAKLYNNLTNNPYLYQEINKTTEILFPIFSENCQTRVLIPIKGVSRFWGLIGIECKTYHKDSLLNDNEIRNFLEIACGQLEVAVRSKNQQRDLMKLSKIQDELFIEELDITKSLQSILDNLIFALPNIGPLKITPNPEVQILFYREGDEFLTIKATTGSEKINTRLSVENSISGHLIENPYLPYYLCEPKSDPRYKSYLGKSEIGDISKIIETELVIPLKIDNKIIGLINFESEIQNAFKPRHIEAMIKLAEKVSPIVNALQKRLEKIQLQDVASVYAMKKFLKRISKTFVHKFRSPTSNIHLNLRLVMDEINKLENFNNNQHIEAFQRSLSGFNDLNNLQEEFAEALPSYLDFECLSINDIINGAINDISNPEELKQDKLDFEIIYNNEKDYKVFCSRFLREHIYNILNNSKYSIGEKTLNTALLSDTLLEDFTGKIIIETSLIVDQEESEINQQCKIRIRDNGKGLNKEMLNSVPKPFTTKASGTGYGISAAYHYLKSIGGRMELDSEENNFFEVVMYLDIFDDRLHSNGRGENLWRNNNEKG